MSHKKASFDFAHLLPKTAFVKTPDPKDRKKKVDSQLTIVPLYDVQIWDGPESVGLIKDTHIRHGKLFGLVPDSANLTELKKVHGQVNDRGQWVLTGVE